MKRNTPRHPKVFTLAESLNLHPTRDHARIIGYLELLWHFTSEFAPQGDIGRYSDERIEAACSWYGKKGMLVEALTTSGWCDKSDLCRIVVHDWHDHADDATRKKLERVSKCFLSDTSKPTRKFSHGVEKASRNVSLPSLANPEPLPEPDPEPEEPPLPPSCGTVAGKNANAMRTQCERIEEPGNVLALFDDGVVRSNVPARRAKDQIEADHDVWYAEYWKKADKAGSLKAYRKRRAALAKQGQEDATLFLIDMVQQDRERFEDTPDWEWRRNLHPATWLNGERWNDEPSAPARNQNSFAASIQRACKRNMEETGKPW